MKTFNVVNSFSLIVIFIAMFFIHYMLNNFFAMTEVCTITQSLNCDDAGMNTLLIFTFFIVMAFIVLIETTIYFIFKEVEIEVLAKISDTKKEMLNAKELEVRKKEIKRSKNDLRKKYFRREIEENTYKSMKEAFDKELLEVDGELKKLKFIKK